MSVSVVSSDIRQPSHSISGQLLIRNIHHVLSKISPIEQLGENSEYEMWNASGVFTKEGETHSKKVKGKEANKSGNDLLNSCLKSPLLPAYLAASFAKKLSRLALTVPPSGGLGVLCGKLIPCDTISAPRCVVMLFIHEPWSRLVSECLFPLHHMSILRCSSSSYATIFIEEIRWRVKQSDNNNKSSEEIETKKARTLQKNNQNRSPSLIRAVLADKTRETSQPMVVPISTREPKRNVNQPVATSHKKIVAQDSTVKKPRYTTRKLYEQVSKTCSWWYPKFTSPGYKWKPKSIIGNVNLNSSMPLGNENRNANISEHMTPRCSTISNTLLSSNSFVARTVKFGNDQIAPILGYGDLVQGTITIKRVYYVKGLNHNLFSVGQFCDANLEVAFRKSTCYIRDLKGNDLLTGSRGTDLYSITLQDTPTPNPICLMAKATSSQAWL
ncbi:hypothetical protein Tco_1060817 [Tanacetum coccineum]